MQLRVNKTELALTSTGRNSLIVPSLTTDPNINQN